MEIQTPNGGKIEYFYSDPEISTFYRKNTDKVDGGANGVVSKYSKINSNQYHIKEIKFSTGSIHFIADTTEREDLLHAYSLKKVIVNDKKNNQIKEFELNYFYTEGGSTNQLEHLVNLDVKSKKRMFLDNILEKDKNGVNTLPPYKFKYNSELLPVRFSTSRDIWGYYNGADNGSFLTFFNELNTQDNRNPSSKFLAAGTLEEIEHPTKGKSKFYFEQNIVKSSYVNKNVIFTGRSETITKIDRITKKDFQYDGSGFQVFSVEVPARTKIEFTCVHLSSNPNSDCIGKLGDCDNTNTVPDCIFRLLFSDNGSNYAEVFPGNSFQRSEGYLYFKINPLLLRDENNQLLYLRDDYDFEIRLTYEDPIIKDSEVYGGGRRISKIENYDNDLTLVNTKTFSYTGAEGISTGELIGLPPYKLKAMNSFGSYNIFFQHGNMTGSPVSDIQGNSLGYSKVIEYKGTVENNNGKIETDYLLMSDGASGYNYPYNLPNSYDWLRGVVLEETIYKSTKVQDGLKYDKKRKVKNEYLYAGSLDFEGRSSIAQLASTQTYLPFDRNILLDDYQYKKNRRLFKLPFIQLIWAKDLRLLDRTDVMIQEVEDDLFRKKKDAKGVDTNEYVIPGQTYYYKVYQLTGGTQDLWKTTESIYNNAEEIERRTINEYDYDRHYQLKSSETTNSTGEVIKVINYYPTDKNDLSGISDEFFLAIDNLALDNRFEVIENQVYRDSVLQSTQRTNYKSENGLTLLGKVQTSKATNKLEDRVIYHSYDDKGNPTEVSKKDGTHVVYIWGYNQTQPIAKVENATLSQVNLAIASIDNTDFNTLNKLQNVSNLDIDTASESTLRTALDALRNIPVLSDSQVTTFTYDPLIGVTSITDSRGQVIYYEYDNFNRLEFVKDTHKNILKENKYNYKN